MKKLKNVRLNIFDYLVITVLIIIIIYVSFMKISSSKTKNVLHDINVFLFCDNVPTKAKDGLKVGTEVYAGSKELKFGILKEFKVYEEKDKGKFFNVTFKTKCRARKNDSGGYIIDGTTYYLGQEVRLFANSTLMSGYIYEIEEIN